MFFSRAIVFLALTALAHACATTETATPAPPPPLIPDHQCVSEPTAADWWSPTTNMYGGQVNHDQANMHVWYDVTQTTTDPLGPVLLMIETSDHLGRRTDWQYLALPTRIVVERVVRCIQGSLERRWIEDLSNGKWKAPKKPKPTKKKGR